MSVAVSIATDGARTTTVQSALFSASFARGCGNVRVQPLWALFVLLITFDVMRVTPPGCATYTSARRTWCCQAAKGRIVFARCAFLFRSQVHFASVVNYSHADSLCLNSTPRRSVARCIRWTCSRACNEPASSGLTLTTSGGGRVAVPHMLPPPSPSPQSLLGRSGIARRRHILPHFAVFCWLSKLLLSALRVSGTTTAGCSSPTSAPRAGGLL